MAKVLGIAIYVILGIICLISIVKNIREIVSKFKTLKEQKKQRKIEDSAKKDERS